MLAKDKKINKSSEESSSTFGVVKDRKTQESTNLHRPLFISSLFTGLRLITILHSSTTDIIESTDQLPVTD